ncbi:hypothetical protein LTR85_004242 [Meristemomyces frigidus]|nr:hypothetical protein LTR85_004242 [Meristemomyces frigidus]
MTDPTITTGSKDRVPQASALYEAAFRKDPVIAYMFGNLSEDARHAWLYTYFSALLTAAGLNGAIFEEADDFSSCSVVMPPGCRVDNPWTLLPAGILKVTWKLGLKGCWRMLGEYAPVTDAAKAKGLKGEKSYYYLFFLATKEDCRGKGLSSALIKKAKERAQADGVPLWLEATTEYSWKLYGSLGFETVERMVLGKGVAAADGRRKECGEGVPFWGMIWWPEKQT